MNDAPKDGTWIIAKRKSGRELVVSWRRPGKIFLIGDIAGGIFGFLGRELRWITDTGKAGEVPFDRLVSWRQLPEWISAKVISNE